VRREGYAGPDVGGKPIPQGGGVERLKQSRVAEWLEQALHRALVRLAVGQSSYRQCARILRQDAPRFSRILPTSAFRSFSRSSLLTMLIRRVE